MTVGAYSTIAFSDYNRCLRDSKILCQNIDRFLQSGESFVTLTREKTAKTDAQEPTAAQTIRELYS